MKKLLRPISIISLLLIIGYIILHFVVRNKVKSFLEEQKEENKLSYSDYSINLINGSASIDSVSVEINEDKFSAEKIKLKRVGYLAYLFKDKISVNELSVEKPTIELQQNKQEKEEESDADDSFDKDIKIKSFSIAQADLSLLNGEHEQLRLKNYNLKLSGIKVTEESLENKLPFSYESYTINGGALNYHANQLQTVRWDSIALDTKNALVQQIQLLPNYTREDYVEVIDHEDDLMNIELSELLIDNYDFDLEEERFSSSRVDLKDVNANIYRDKTVEDDTTRKKLYSAMLRDLSFDLTVDTLEVDNADLTYEEVQENTEKVGKVFFKQMNVLGTNITNVDMESDAFPETNIDITTQFMGTSPLDVNWRFKINDPKDNFRITGHSVDIPPKAMNGFFEAALNLKAKGEGINQLDFDFKGNDSSADGIYKMVFDDLEVEELKDEKALDKVLSAVANIFMKKERTENDEKVEIEDVERDDTRSFWNYLWKCVAKGLEKSLI